MEAFYVVVGEDGVDPVAWLALVVSVLTVAWTVWSEFTSYRRRQADEHWYRGIFSPNCIEPLVEFLNLHLSSLQSIDVGKATADETRRFCEDFASRKESLLSKLWVSQLFSGDYYSLACEQLDEIEDEMVTKFGGWVMKPASASGRDLETLRDEAIAKVTIVLASAARINLNRFSEQQKRIMKRRRTG